MCIRQFQAFAALSAALQRHVPTAIWQAMSAVAFRWPWLLQPMIGASEPYCQLGAQSSIRAGPNRTLLQSAVRA
jgi:hypothetical protein